MPANHLLARARFTAAADVDGAPHDEARVLNAPNDVRHVAPVRRDRRLELKSGIARHMGDVRGRDGDWTRCQHPGQHHSDPDEHCCGGHAQQRKADQGT